VRIDEHARRREGGEGVVGKQQVGGLLQLPEGEEILVR
jgi:hypothetical protein